MLIAEPSWDESWPEHRALMISSILWTVWAWAVSKGCDSMKPAMRKSTLSSPACPRQLWDTLSELREDNFLCLCGTRHLTVVWWIQRARKYVIKHKLAARTLQFAGSFLSTSMAHEKEHLFSELWISNSRVCQPNSKCNRVDKLDCQVSGTACFETRLHTQARPRFKVS